jgi:hypothetical protein
MRESMDFGWLEHGIWKRVPHEFRVRGRRRRATGERVAEVALVEVVAEDVGASVRERSSRGFAREWTWCGFAQRLYSA